MSELNPEIKTDRPRTSLGKRFSEADLSSVLYGRVQPQARDLEEAVLGAMMLEKDAVALVIDILKPESFYVEAHQLIFKAIHNLFNKSQPVDILTVTEELRKQGDIEKVGGAFAVAELTNRVGSAANVEYHARIISQKYIQRELIRISSLIIKDSYEDTTDVLELLDKAEKNIYEITDKNLRRNYNKISDLVTKAVKQLQSLMEKEIDVTGVPSGFTELDRITGGWQKSDLIIMAARPGMGKTAFVLSLARNAAVDFKKPIAFFSLEMSDLQLTQRLISSETMIPSDKLRRGNLEQYEWEHLTSKIETLSEAPIFIDDTPAINVFELRAKCRRLKMQHDIQMIVIDYLQLMSGGGSDKGGNREQEISSISRSLKSIAKELNVPVIALSQLSRAVETRGGSKKPQLSDLRESGAIEQDADMVLFIYRPDYYGMNQDEAGQSTSGLAEILISKHRNGALGSVQLKFIDRFAKFADYNMMTPPAQGTYADNPEGSITIMKSQNWDKPEEDAPF
ncbi:MAG TPA: replicative DNA helicase [Bacteroidetes bacterium]|nr:replicative DNA helicase [Bacteroidota bacterium]